MRYNWLRRFVFSAFLFSFVPSMRNILVSVVLVLAYIFLLTGMFEVFINRSSSTLLTVSAIGIFIVMTLLLARFLIKQFKNH
ncbi:MAG TPA: hypothetical protein VFR58_14530 [Flavisolibacter sp.]|nr:hypothetical protein [Flavisolibacter sp.]